MLLPNMKIFKPILWAYYISCINLKYEASAAGSRGPGTISGDIEPTQCAADSVEGKQQVSVNFRVQL